ncbi:hypothetical protein TNCV_924541 [Trichonephila clavipes]|nr:hypothetical protein TNCV_924541 [Trichonephila clavipes]
MIKIKDKNGDSLMDLVHAGFMRNMSRSYLTPIVMSVAYDINAVTPKCRGGPSVNRDRRTAHLSSCCESTKERRVVDPKSGERRLVSLLLSGSRGRKSSPKEDSSRCVWRKQTAMSVRDNI